MHFIYRNVNHAFEDLVQRIRLSDKPHESAYTSTARRSSRVGDIIQVTEPMTITYQNPRQRVLFNKVRDANPFFHLYESLWMLAGRNDVAPLTYYSSQYGKIVSDDGVTQHGAYGWRWIRHFTEDGGRVLPIDQLKEICDNLRKNPDCRRQVLAMWDPSSDLGTSSKDLPCNTHAYFLVNDCKLDMTVCNRSNDMIWGMLGANVVHFSILQEYMAACIGVEVGVYNQFTNNLHVYTDRWIPDLWLADRTLDYYTVRAPYGEVRHVDYIQPLVKDPNVFDLEVKYFVERHQQDALAMDLNEPFLRETAQPMCVAFHHYKRKDDGLALATIESVKSDDWRIAGRNWLRRRAEGWEKRHAQTSTNQA